MKYAKHGCSQCGAHFASTFRRSRKTRALLCNVCWIVENNLNRGTRQRDMERLHETFLSGIYYPMGFLQYSRYVAWLVKKEKPVKRGRPCRRQLVE